MCCILFIPCELIVYLIIKEGPTVYRKATISMPSQFQKTAAIRGFWITGMLL